MLQDNRLRFRKRHMRPGSAPDSKELLPLGTGSVLAMMRTVRSDSVHWPSRRR